MCITGDKYDLNSIHSQLHCLSTLRQDICLAGRDLIRGHIWIYVQNCHQRNAERNVFQTRLNRHQHFSDGMGQDTELTRVQLAIETPSLWTRAEASLWSYGLLTDHSVMMQSGLMVSEHFNKRRHENKTVGYSQPANLIIYWKFKFSLLWSQILQQLWCLCVLSQNV